MAIFRKIHTQFWGDTFVQTLTPEKKYFYLYLLTNEKTKQCGIYEISTRQISYDTGYNVETVNALLDYFIHVGKIFLSRETNEIAIKNWWRYNESRSPTVQKLVKQEFKLVKNQKLIEWIYSMDTVPILNVQEEEEEEEEEEENKNKKDVGFYQSRLPIVQQLLNIWVGLNTNYKIDDSDKMAMRYLAIFICGKKGLEHLTDPETATLKENWNKWCFYILQSQKLKNFSLEKISRFYHKEIHQELLNPSKNATHKQSASSKSAGAEKLLGHLKDDIRNNKLDE